MLRKIRTAWLKARIAWHRRQALSHSRPARRTFKRREEYVVWMHNMALRHSKRASELERELAAVVRETARRQYPEKVTV